MKIARGTPLPNTIEGTKNIVQNDNDRFGIYFDYDRICEYIYYYDCLCNEGTRELRKLSGVPDYVITKRDQTLDILVKRLGVPMQYLLNSAGAVTTDQKVLKQAAEAYAGTGSVIEEFFNVYQKTQKASTAVSSYKSYRDLPMCNTLDRDNHRMVVAHPTWSILSTSRLAANKPQIQNIDRERGDIITAPKGWQLVRADSGQIEPRIMWSYFFKDPLMTNLIIAYNDAYFAYYDFVTMSQERESALRNDFERNFIKNEITPEMQEGRQQMKRISLAAGYGSTLPKDAGFDPRLAKLYTEKIVNHPVRKAYEKSIRDQVYNGVESFRGAFGSIVTPESNSKYIKGQSGWTEHVIRCGINNPIQTTASELMIFAVNRAALILATKCRNSYICYYKHDEGCFYLNEDNGSMDYADELADCQSYQIEGWIPIYSEKEVGRKEPHNAVPNCIGKKFA